ncbi:MAG: GNAT family N-acetyltransferase [Candidatus Poribacteria bacterium]|nr:GNAT family N-acetyltransferase [Candidatus Poribacteria bacterium]
MNVKLRAALRMEMDAFDRIVQFYQYDFSEIEDGDVEKDGRFHYIDVSRYWTGTDFRPYFILVNDQIAGFAVVREESKSPPKWWMEEFFVMRKYRRYGTGRHAAMCLFDMFPGEWEVWQSPNNKVARAFWRSVIGAYTNKNFEDSTHEIHGWTGTLQRFRSG